MKYLVRRILFSFFVILAVVAVTFVLVRILPGDPVSSWVGEHPTQTQLEQARRELGLNEPLAIQAWKYISNVAKGDLGISLRTGRPVRDEIGRRFAATLELTTIAMLGCFLLGVPIGVLAANKPDGWFAKTEKLFSLSGIAIPIFWLGMLLQILFSGTLGWLPLQGQRGLPPPETQVTGLLLLDTLITGQWSLFTDALAHIIMPALTLSMACFGIVTRTVRNAMSGVLQSNYIRAAHAFGIGPNRVLFVHALKNALIPVITVSGLVYGYLLGGTFLVERVFDWQGLGQFAVLSILTNDLPAVTGVALVYALIYTTINLALDLIYQRVDPRLERG